MKKLKRGDVLLLRREYRTIGPSDYTGIVYTCVPLVLFPVSGHVGNALALHKVENYQVIATVNLGFIPRLLNILKSAWWIGNNPQHRA